MVNVECSMLNVEWGGAFNVNVQGDGRCWALRISAAFNANLQPRSGDICVAPRVSAGVCGIARIRAAERRHRVLDSMSPLRGSDCATPRFPALTRWATVCRRSAAENRRADSCGVGHVGYAGERVARTKTLKTLNVECRFAPALRAPSFNIEHSTFNIQHSASAAEGCR